MATIRRENHRLRFLLRVVYWVAVVLFFKTFLAVVLEYRNYFPANFESNFLSGRELTFRGLYRFTFYAHIISGPFALGISAFLMATGKRKFWHAWHKRLGKWLVWLTMLILLPSGMVMATQAFTGPIAGISFFALSSATTFALLMAARHAMNRRFVRHQLWATRSFILLSSPLLLRLMTGATIVLGIESDWTYRFAAWGSWILPVAIFEVVRNYRLRSSKRKTDDNFLLTSLSTTNQLGMEGTDG